MGARLHALCGMYDKTGRKTGACFCTSHTSVTCGLSARGCVPGALAHAYDAPARQTARAGTFRSPAHGEHGQSRR